MTSNIKGRPQMDTRFRAIVKEVSRPTAERWQKNATKRARDLVGGFDMPYSKGDLENSIRVGAISVQSGHVTRAKVVMEYHGYFVDSGTQGNGTQSRFSRHVMRRGVAGRTVFSNRTNFSKKARNRRGGGYGARPFRERAAQEAMRQISMAQILIDAWNGAA